LQLLPPDTVLSVSRQNSMATIDQEIVKLLIACWGALTGTIAIALNLINYNTERARLKLAWLRNFAVTTIGPHGIQETGERFARLLVTNIGRHQLRVIGAYAVHLDERGEIKLFMFADGLLDPSKNRVLGPEQPSTEYHVQEHQMLDRVVFIGVNDAIGRTHPLWLVPWYRRFTLRRKMKFKSTKTEAPAR